MAPRSQPRQSLQHEKLQYFVLLRQMEAPTADLRRGYQRLADSAAAAEGWDLRTVILDWLEAELRALRRAGEGPAPEGQHYLKAAVALSSALGQ